MQPVLHRGRDAGLVLPAEVDRQPARRGIAAPRQLAVVGAGDRFPAGVTQPTDRGGAETRDAEGAPAAHGRRLRLVSRLGLDVVVAHLALTSARWVTAAV